MRTVFRPAQIRHAALVLAFVACLAPLSAQETLNPAEVLPDDTVFFLHIGTWKSWSDGWKNTSLAKIVAEPEVQKFIAGPLKNLWTAADQAMDGGTKTMGNQIVDFIGDRAPGPILIALRYNQELADAKRPPAVGLIIGAKANLGTATLLQQAIVALPLGFRKADYKADTITTFATERYEISFCVRKDHIIVTTDEKFCEALIDGLDKTAGKKLGEIEIFKATGMGGGEQLSGYLDVSVFKKLLGSGVIPPGQFKEILVKAGLEDLQAMAWSLKMDGPAFESRTGIVGTGKRTGILGYLDVEPVSAEALKLCPADCPYTLGVRVKPDQLFTLMAGTFYAGNPEVADLEKHYAEKGGDLKKKLADTFGGEFVLTSFSGIHGAPLGVLNPTAYSLSVKDPAEAEKLFLELMESALAQHNPPLKAEDVLKTIEIDGVKVRYLDTPNARGNEPKYAFTGNRLLVTLDMETMKAALKQLKQPGLAEGERFKEALAASGGQLGPIFLYVDWGHLYASAFDKTSVVLKFLSSFGLLNRFGVNINLLPSLEAVDKHLFPALMLVKPTEHGVVLSSRGPLPSVEVMAPPLAAFSAVVMTFGSSRKQDAPVVPAPAPQGAPK